MTKKTKAAIITGVILFTVGLALVIGTVIAGLRPHTVRTLFASAQGDYHHHNNSTVVSEEYTTYDTKDIAQLDIDVDVTQVFITTGSEFTVRAENTEDLYITSFLQKDGTLKVDDRGHKRKWMNVRPTNAPSVFITIPQGMNFREIDIENNVGTVELNVLDIATEKLSLSTDVGEMNIENITSSQTEISVAVGSIDVSGTFTGKTELECELGSIEFSSIGNFEDWSYETETELGSITINENSITGVGKQKSENQKANHLEIKSALGNITVSIL